MTVLVDVLSSLLLAYVERSRTQKNISPKGEVAHSAQIAMSDMGVHDELLEHSEKDERITNVQRYHYENCNNKCIKRRL